MFSFFRNTFFSSSIISIGKILTIILFAAILLNPDLVSAVPQGLKITIGLFALTFAVFGLLSCCYGFSRVLLTAGFWVIAIYFISNAFIYPAGFSINKKSITASIPKILPGGLMYDEIPDHSEKVLSAGFKLPGLPGTEILDTLYSYVSNPFQGFSQSLDISTLGFKSASFNDMSFSSGVLPDNAYFVPASKRNFYPIHIQKSDSGLSSITKLLPIK